jgi:hypothetical protein
MKINEIHVCKDAGAPGTLYNVASVATVLILLKVFSTLYPANVSGNFMNYRVRLQCTWAGPLQWH